MKKVAISVIVGLFVLFPLSAQAEKKNSPGKKSVEGTEPATKPVKKVDSSIPPAVLKNLEKLKSLPQGITVSRPFSIDLTPQRELFQKLFAQVKSLKLTDLDRVLLREWKKLLNREATRGTYTIYWAQKTALLLYQQKGQEHFFKLGVYLLYQFENTLKKYLKAGGSPLKIYRDNPKELSALSRQLIDLAGYYPLLFKNAGVSKDFLLPINYYWLRTIYLARWLKLLKGYLPLSVLMPRELYISFLQLRFLKGTKQLIRVQALRELNKLDPKKYPVYRLMGWLALQNRDFKSAALFFERAVKSDPKDLYSKELLEKIVKLAHK